MQILFFFKCARTEQLFSSKERCLKYISDNRNIDQDDAECRRRMDGSVEGCHEEKRKVRRKERRKTRRKEGSKEEQRDLKKKRRTEVYLACR